MRIKEEVKVIEQKVKTYIAEDGKEFESRYECEKYEEKLHYSEKVKEAEKLRVEKLDQLTPIMYNDYLNGDNVFIWYKVESENDLHTLKEAYSNFDSPIITSYPEFVCVESIYSPSECGEDTYWYTLTSCKTDTEDFWKTMGYKVTLEKM